jgi:PAS domain S-box-containing protein
MLLKQSEREGVLMRCQHPISRDPSETIDACELAYPSKMDDRIFSSLGDLPKQPRAMYLIKPGPREIPRTTSSGALTLRDNILGRRIPPVSRESALRNLHEDVDRELHQAQDNFATVFHASPAILCIIQLDGLRYREVNKTYEQRTGYNRSEVLGKTSLGLGLWDNADDRERAIRKLLAKGCIRSHQAVFQTRTGERLTTLLSAEIIEFGGEKCALVVAEDITERRQAEEARVDVAQRLINAQEAERARVGRELHDNIGQSLAMCNMELEKTRLTLADLSVDTNSRLIQLRGKLQELSQIVGNLSHQLHSSHLELLGFVAAVKGLCRGFAEQYLIPAHCNCSGVLENLSADVALCLFRVMQEALHNIAKHGHATNVDVEVIGTRNKIHLKIADDGVGFTPNAQNKGHGLGLISMRERLYLVGGKFAIVSKRGCGTRVEATVPLHFATKEYSQ